jgi:murein DD-endopeptidase / murein LD-carboxypeptidase
VILKNNDTCNIINYAHVLASVVLTFCLLLIGGCAIHKKNTSDKYKVHVIASAAPVSSNSADNKSRSLQVEFGSRLSISADSIINLRLYAFVKKWLGTPYRWGGTNANGIDCSAFVQKLYRSVYDIDVPRTSIEQFYTKWVDLYSSARYLTEGDLVFFKTLSNYQVVSHVGFYLRNGYFVNASSARGVSIDRLTDNYWSSKYVAAGRLKKGNTSLPK